MIVTVACTKGGAGKSTVATNLAVAASHRQGAGAVALIDADIQKTSFYWHEKRAEKPSLAEIPCFHITGTQTYTKILELGSHFKTLVVDAGGRASAELQLAIAAADRVLVPVQPSAADGMALDDTLDALARVRKELGSVPDVMAFLSRSSTNPRDKDSDEMMAYLREIPSLRVLEERTRDRKAYREALAQGRGVAELGPAAEKAAEELTQLYKAAIDSSIGAVQKGAARRSKHG